MLRGRGGFQEDSGAVACHLVVYAVSVVADLEGLALDGFDEVEVG